MKRQNDVTIGDVVDIGGEQWKIESYSHTGRNCIATTLPDAPKFERILIIFTDGPPITEIPA